MKDIIISKISDMLNKFEPGQKIYVISWDKPEVIEYNLDKFKIEILSKDDYEILIYLEHPMCGSMNNVFNFNQYNDYFFSDRNLAEMRMKYRYNLYDQITTCYTEAEFHSVFNRVKCLCEHKRGLNVIHEQIAHEIDKSILNRLHEEVLYVNQEIADDIVMLQNVMYDVTSANKDLILKQMKHEFANFTGKDSNEAYDISCRLLKYFDIPKEA